MPVEGGSEAVSVLSLPNSDDLLVFFFFLWKPEELLMLHSFCLSKLTVLGSLQHNNWSVEL